MDKKLGIVAALALGLLVGDFVLGTHGMVAPEVTPNKMVGTPHFLRARLAECVEGQVRMRLPAEICQVQGYAHIQAPVWF
jgi:hypothetical protein